jgi:hypothetical protein
MGTFRLAIAALAVLFLMPGCAGQGGGQAGGGGSGGGGGGTGGEVSGSDGGPAGADAGLGLGTSDDAFTSSCAVEACTSDERCLPAPWGSSCVHPCPGQPCPPAATAGAQSYCTRTGGVICDGS